VRNAWSGLGYYVPVPVPVPFNGGSHPPGAIPVGMGLVDGFPATVDGNGHTHTLSPWALVGSADLLELRERGQYKRQGKSSSRRTNGSKQRRQNRIQSKQVTPKTSSDTHSSPTENHATNNSEQVAPGKVKGVWTAVLEVDGQGESVRQEN